MSATFSRLRPAGQRAWWVPRPLDVVGVLLLALAFFTYRMFDFRVFWEAGRHVLSGQRIYPSRAELDLDTRAYFVYPPLVAILFVPLALLPFAVAAAVYACVMVAAIWGTLRLLGIGDRRCYVVLLFWMPMLQAIGLGTIAPLLALALALAWKHRERTWILSCAVALAVVAKLFLWPLFFWLLATRRWRAALASGSIAAALIVLPWAALGFRDFGWYPHALQLLLDHEQLTGFSTAAVLTPLHVPGLALVVDLLAVAAVFVVATRMEGDRRAFSAAVVCALVFSPLVWVHYYALLVVPIALARRRFAWLWLVPMVAFWPATNNVGHWEIALGVSAVLVFAGVFTLLSANAPVEEKVDAVRADLRTARIYA